VEERTVEILEHRRRSGLFGSRRGVVRRMLVVADLIGLSLAFLVTHWIAGPGAGSANHYGSAGEFVIFFVLLPVWVMLARLYRLYDRDEERAEHSTADDLVGVFHLVTVSTWGVLALGVLTNLITPDGRKLLVLWALSISFVTLGRIAARTAARQSLSYVQNCIIVGAGDVGQLLARKILQHPEYRINVVGLVDSEPKERRPDLGQLTVLGPIERLPELIALLDVDRVIIAFSKEPPAYMVELVRALRQFEIQIDIVPRLFDVVGPRAELTSIEGIQLVGLPPPRLGRGALFVKRMLDVVVAGMLLILTAPLFAYIAWRIRRDSGGPIFFRQTRLGMNQRPFTALKFRTMRPETSSEAHRDYIASMAEANGAPQQNGLFKLEREESVTEIGRWLRKTSLDELPQLLNVLRGDMSLVGPRPCIPYEIETFAPHHFERFIVPAGVTGLWQVEARARSTFLEALEMDVAYARGWSMGLDLQLLLKTPIQLLRSGVTR
jgi:exopolysaccharide biosynthesis polyprenyl glycosylphosphotransferase